ncbi:MAG: nitroreductase family protein [Candidatus Firestonebacteria bacterium]
MSKILIEPTKCDKCGTCILECPAAAISTDGNGFPEISEAKKTACIRCGHCEAVCPKEALTLQFRTGEKSSSAMLDGKIPPEKLTAFLKPRRSIRRFKKSPVPEETLKNIMEGVRYSPTGGNRQGVKWLIIHSPGQVKLLTGLCLDWMKELAKAGPDAALKFPAEEFLAAAARGRDLFCWNAPHLAIAYSHKLNGSGQTDAVIALSHFELLCKAHGLGTCWAGFFVMALKQWEPLLKELKLPEDHIPNYALLFGYPAVEYKLIPRRKPLTVEYR